MKIDLEIAGRSIAYPELVRLIESSRHSDTRKRDMVSAVNRVLKMGGVWGGTFVFTVESLRCLIASIKPAAHGVSPKSFANIQSNLRAALREAGIVATAQRPPDQARSSLVAAASGGIAKTRRCWGSAASSTIALSTRSFPAW